MLSFLFIKNNPAKLYESYLESCDTEFKEKILSRLIELNSEEFLTKIFKTSYTDKIFDYLYPRCMDNAQNLYELFSLSPKEIQTRIVSQLVILQNEQILLKFIRTDFEDQVFDFFLNKYKDDIESLLSFARSVKKDNQKRIIQLIITQKKATHIKKLYNSEFKEMLIDYLVNNYAVLNSENDQFLLAQDQSLREEIIQRLLKDKSHGVKSNYKIDFIQIAILQTHNCDIIEFILFWEPFMPIICLNDNLLKYYFFMLNDMQKLYILLWQFGLDKYYNVPKLNYNLSAIEENYYLVQDCKSYNLKHLEALFEKIFHNVVERFDYKLGLLAYLIDHEQFEFYLTDAEIFMEEMLYEKMEDINEKIDELGSDYSNNSHAVQGEINFLIFKKNFEKLKTISKYKNPIIEPVIFKKMHFDSAKRIGKLLDFSTLTKEAKFVDNLMRERQLLTSHIDKMTNQMSDPKTIARMTEAAEKRLANMIDINDFLYSIQDLKLNEQKNHNELCEILAGLLQKSNDLMVQKSVLKIAIDYEAFPWSDYLVNDNFDFSNIELAYYYNLLAKAHPNTKLLINLGNMIDIKPVLHNTNSFNHLMECTNILISPNNTLVASTGKEKTVNITNLETKQNYKYYHTTEIIRIYFSQNFKYLYSVGTDNSVKSYNLHSKALEDSFKQKPQFEFVCSNYSSSLVFGKNENELKIYESVQKAPLFTFKHTHFIQDILLTNDDKQLISYTNYEVRICNISNPEEAHIFKTKRSINSLDISNNNHLIIIGMGDRWKGEIKLFEIDSLKESFSLETDFNVKSVAISSNSTMYAYILNEKERSEIIVNDVDFNNEIFKYSTITLYNKIIFWPETSYIVTIADYRLDIFDLKTKKLFTTMQFNNKINKCTISSDGSFMTLAITNEVVTYNLLDIMQMSAYNILQNLLSIRIEQDAEAVAFIRKNATRYLNHDSATIREGLKDFVDYFL